MLGFDTFVSCRWSISMKSLKSSPVTLGCLSALALYCINARAQDQEASNAPLALSPITITASRNQTLLEDMPVHTTVIRADAIQQSPFQSLDELLKTIPGFNFSGAPSYLSDPTGTQTKIRGLGNAKVLVLLDGVPMLDPFYLTTQWFRVPLSTIERVEIVRGGSSSLWGSMAVGGVVNVVTKVAKDNVSNVSWSYGSFNTSNLAIDTHVVVSDELRIQLGATQLQTHGYQVTPSQYLYMYPGKAAPTDTNGSYQLSAYLTPSKAMKGFFKLNYFSQNQDLYGVYGQNLQKTPNFSAGITNWLAEGASVDSKVWWQKVTFNKTNGSGCYWVSATSCLNGGSSTPPTLLQASAPSVNYFSQYGAQAYQERGASTVYSKTLNALIRDVQVGADLRELSVQDTEQYFGAPTPSNPQNSVGTAYGQGTQTFTGAFVQTRLLPWDATVVTLSARVDHWSNTNRNFGLTTAAHGLSPASGPFADNTKTQFNPSMGVRHEMNDALAYRASVYKAFRAPGLNNQTRSYGTTIANPNLMPETVTGWELGVDIKTAKSDFSATYFSNRLGNMIATSTYTTANVLPQPVINLCSTAPLGGTPNLTNCGSAVSFYSNNQNGHASGLELSEQWKARADLTLDASYALTMTELTSTWNGVTTPLHAQLVGIPQHTASLAATWLPERGWRVYAQMSYMGALSYYQSSSINAVQGANVVFNASLGYQMNSSTDVFANGVNVFNRQYQDGAYTATAPQTQTLSVPRMISVGFRHRF
jgi:iron complex outermembrane receptor protein